MKGLSFEPVWIDSSRFWFRSEEDEGFRYVLIDVRAATRTPVFDHVRLAAQLAEQIGQVVDEGAFNFPHFSLAPDLSTMDFIFADRLWHYDLASGVLNLRGPAVATPGYWGNEEEERGRIEVPSLDGRKVAWVEGWNLKLLDAASGQITTLSQDGSAEHYYSNRLIWSPDSQHIAAARITLPAERSLLLLESTPREGGLPRLQTRHYPRAGDPVIQREPRIFGIDGKVLEADPALFPDPYRLDGFRWNRRGDVLSFDYADRAYQLYRVLGMSASDGRVWSQVEERSDTYINLPRIYRFDLADDRHMLWASERDGYNHLYLYERVSGRKIRQITHGLWYVRDVLRVDELRREIVFSANGVNPAEDPYLIRYYRIGFDGKDMRDITPAPGMHSAWLSPDGRYLLDRWSTLSLPPQTAVRDALTGEVLMPVERVDDRTLKTLGWSAPEPFVAKGRDGVTDIWGVIIRPSDFDPSRVYPVIECIYASPGGQFVPKRFMPDHWPMTAMAELGFIVVQIDGMGTSFRSRSFENVIWKNLADSGLSDRIAWIKAAAQTRPWMDISRVGIFGASAGGHSAMAAVLHHPEFYKAAFAAAGSHDNRLDKRWWNEQWMGYPVGPGYAASSNVDNAWRLTRPLMLLVGELDDNVDPASTLRVADALIRAKKDFELVFMPGVGHTLGGSYGDHKRYDFFVRTLMGRSPPNWQLLEDQGRPSP
ncbi:S9 family peptidase [Candidatus Dactylopiibacterium carminicum]|uniref:S9 family peptidase n=1 Tax=Candidatus Dactylopiibacterium carminicum TaxID=857335 RepID=UPI00148337B0|nr:S9 family peptidase [Candidatus Dactylopiibacterium carminicum]